MRDTRQTSLVASDRSMVDSVLLGMLQAGGCMRPRSGSQRVRYRHQVEAATGKANALSKQGDVIAWNEPRCYRPTGMEMMPVEMSKATTKPFWSPDATPREGVGEMAGVEYAAVRCDRPVTQARFSARDGYL